jgi:hypothetical protein
LYKKYSNKINTAASICLGMLKKRGEKNIINKNNTPITIEVIPVRPPSLTPDPTQYMKLPLLYQEVHQQLFLHCLKEVLCQYLQHDPYYQLFQLR